MKIIFRIYFCVFLFSLSFFASFSSLFCTMTFKQHKSELRLRIYQLNGIIMSEDIMSVNTTRSKVKISERAHEHRAHRKKEYYAKMKRRRGETSLHLIRIVFFCTLFCCFFLCFCRFVGRHKNSFNHFGVPLVATRTPFIVWKLNSINCNNLLQKKVSFSARLFEIAFNFFIRLLRFLWIATWTHDDAVCVTWNEPQTIDLIKEMKNIH